MTDATNTTIEAIKITASFLSDNSIEIMLIILMIISRKAISSFIERLTTLTFKGGGSELGLEAALPNDNRNIEKKDLHDAIEKPEPEKEKSDDIEDEAKEQSWFVDLQAAFDKGDNVEAENVFEKYALNEKDEIKLEENKAMYLYLKFEEGKDNSAIDELENLVLSAKNEELKFNSLMWLTFCLQDSMDSKKEIEIWTKALEDTKTEKLVTRAAVNLAYAYNGENESNKAKSLLLERLKIVEDGSQISGLYKALSKIELSLGNTLISIYCKDKSLEYDPNNRDELFNSAYAASNENIDEISISNYLKLIRIDRDNSTALNNLGVQAQEAGLKIKAVDNFKKSSSNRNTLAVANQGYLLLDAGFTVEAEKIATEALATEDTHKNIYSLLKAIEEKKDEQESEWKLLSEKSLKRQKYIRKYTEQYYLGISSSIQGSWNVSKSINIDVEIKNKSFITTWQEPGGATGDSSYTVQLKGTVTGGTFTGVYKRERCNEGKSNGLLRLSMNQNIDCIGFITDEGSNMFIMSSESKNHFTLSLTRNTA